MVSSATMLLGETDGAPRAATRSVRQACFVRRDFILRHAFPGPALRLSLAAVMAAMLGACAQSALVADRPASPSASRQAALSVTARTPARVARSRSADRSRSATARGTGGTAAGGTAAGGGAADGVASFYKHGTRTASGEKFNPRELTAAHRTLPFGTRVRVTNVATGRTVTVRVNDRGPFIGGRVIDVSHAAAESLGMVETGVAKVKLDVVR